MHFTRHSRYAKSLPTPVCPLSLRPRRFQVREPGKIFPRAHNSVHSPLFTPSFSSQIVFREFTPDFYLKLKT
jgi:hypothetical protein